MGYGHTHAHTSTAVRTRTSGAGVKFFAYSSYLGRESDWYLIGRHTYRQHILMAPHGRYASCSDGLSRPHIKAFAYTSYPVVFISDTSHRVAVTHANVYACTSADLSLCAPRAAEGAYRVGDTR